MAHKITIGTVVNVPDPIPNSDDLHTHAFIGVLTGYSGGLAKVTDIHGDVYGIEEDRLTNDTFDDRLFSATDMYDFAYTIAQAAMAAAYEGKKNIGEMTLEDYIEKELSELEGG